MTTVPLLPGLVGAITVAAYLLIPPLAAPLGLVSIAVGSAGGLVVWLVLGLIFRWAAEPAHVSSGIFRELQARYLLIASRIASRQLEGIPPNRQAAYGYAVAMLAELMPMFEPTNRSTARVGPQWISGIGYIAAWQRIHRAEEALLLLEPRADLLSAALYDRGRLAGSKIPGRDDMLKQSAAAMVAIDGCINRLLDWKIDPQADCEEMGRFLLVNIRRTVNEYRDDLWEALVYLRRRTVQTLVFTGLTGYVALSLALLVAAPPSAIVAGSAFYLSGALIGLFQAAYLEQRRRSAVEDYGLSSVRLILLPLVGGIAGIIGAVLTAFLGTPPIGLGLLSAPILGDAFDLSKYPLGLLAAAIFGLTPGLLLQRIRALGDDLKLDIARTESSGADEKKTEEDET